MRSLAAFRANETLPGWRSSTAGATRLDDLPAAARTYIERLESLVEVPVHLVSTGPERDENVVLHWPFGTLPDAA